MDAKANDKKRKKGFLGAIWESMTKTGGCCGPASPTDSDKKTKEKKDERSAGRRNES